MEWVIGKNEMELFNLLFQLGIPILSPTGLSVKQFLMETLGFTEAYIAKRVSTLFLDSKPVDDYETALVKADSVIAMSGAMPGLVGAVVRSGSSLSSFRNSITHNEKSAMSVQEKGWVTIKLFNLILSEQTPEILTRGITIRGKEMRQFITDHGTSILNKEGYIQFNTKKIRKLTDLPSWNDNDAIFLKIYTEDRA